jgi:hypothetical protein
MLVIRGGGTVKLILLLLVTPLEVTTTAPLLEATGTVAVICVSDQLTMAALLFAIFTEPWTDPNPLPLICTWVPMGPDEGDSNVMTGLAVVNITSALLLPIYPPIFTGPLVALAGTVATIWVSLQLVTVAPTPLKEIVLLLPLTT